MRRVGSVAIALAGGVLSVTALTWCAAFTADDESSPTSEAGADGEVDAVADGTALDGGAADAATVDSGCRLIVGDPVDSPAWTKLGVAAAIGNVVQLTASGSYEVGGIAHAFAVPLSSFRATITVRVGAHAMPADGMSFFWSPSAGAVLGQSGSNLGFCGDGGPPGSAVAVTTKPNDDDAGTDTVSLRDPSIASCTDTNAVRIPPLANDTAVTFVIEVDVPATTVRVSQGSIELFHTLLPRTFPIASVGVTAATGGEYTRHTVESAVIEVCR